MPDQSCTQMPFTFTPPLRMVSSFCWHTSVPPWMPSVTPSYTQSGSSGWRPSRPVSFSSRSTYVSAHSKRSVALSSQNASSWKSGALKSKFI